MILSSYAVETTSRGFHPQWWPCNSRKQAESLAKKLSTEKDQTVYPNAFWVLDGKKSIGKYFKGARFEPSVSI